VNKEKSDQPTPETLAAYVDGELTPADRSMVERWLGNHPDTRAELDAHQRLGRLWQATRPAEPDDNAWSAPLASLGDRLSVPPVDVPRPRFAFRLLVGIAATAAVVALVSILASKPPPPEIVPVAEAPPFPAASPDDVVITSLWGSAEDMLLVGYPPLRGPMELAGPGDVQMEERSPVPNRNMQINEEPGAPPMVIIEPFAAKEKEK
jgi:anti-sigma factor RsiW